MTANSDRPSIPETAIGRPIPVNFHIIDILPGKDIYPAKVDFIFGSTRGLKLAPGEYEAEAEIYCNMYQVEKKLLYRTKFVI